MTAALTLTSHSDDATRALGASLGMIWRDDPRPLIVLIASGELGTGKTQLARGIVRGLGGDETEVVSPTFTLLNIYDTPEADVHHLDCYRLTGPEDAADVGFEDTLAVPPRGDRRVVVIEWASKVPGLLPDENEAITVTLAHAGVTDRRLTFEGISDAERTGLLQALAGGDDDIGY